MNMEPQKSRFGWYDLPLKFGDLYISWFSRLYTLED